MARARMLHRALVKINSLLVIRSTLISSASSIACRTVSNFPQTENGDVDWGIRHEAALQRAAFLLIPPQALPRAVNRSSLRRRFELPPTRGAAGDVGDHGEDAGLREARAEGHHQAEARIARNAGFSRRSGDSAHSGAQGDLGLHQAAWSPGSPKQEGNYLRPEAQDHFR